MAKEKTIKEKKIPFIPRYFPFVFFFIAIILTISIVLCGKYGWVRLPTWILSNPSQAKLTILNSTVGANSPPTKETKFRYQKDPAYLDAVFFEDFVQVNEQNCYISGSLEIDKTDPPSIIIYSHGSGGRILGKMTPGLMEDLREYAAFFTNENYIFAASDQHGDNWGNKEATEDTIALYSYLTKNYETSGDIYLIGFSMGGLVTFNYALEDPTNVKAIALLAPTTYSAIFDQEKVDSLNEVAIKIWHGDKDTNIDISMSQRLVNKFKLLGRDLDLEVIPGGNHWSVDTELKEEILSFYGESIE